MRRLEVEDSAWQKNTEPFVEKMTRLARNMFEARRKGPNFRAFESLEIDVSGFCNTASKEIENRFCGGASSTAQDLEIAS